MSAPRIVVHNHVCEGHDWRAIADALDLAHDGCTRSTCCYRSVAKAIRGQVKPDEPKGLGAVVEDANGRLWVLADPANEPSWTLENESETTWEKYRDIDVVTVLSEGVVFAPTSPGGAA